MSDRYEKIIENVCGVFGISKAPLRSHRRSTQLVIARQMCIVVLRAGGLSLPQIGKLMNRDHSTILYHLHKNGAANV